MISENLKNLWDKANEFFEQGEDEKAIRLFTKISEAGDWSGSYMLGYIYQTRGMNQRDSRELRVANHKKSLKWFEKAVDQQDQYLAHYGIAKYYYYGLGGVVDYEKAYSHLIKSVSDESFDGDQLTLAYVMLGELLWRGNGCKRDISLSREYFLTAVSLGYPAGLVGLKRIAKYEKKYISAFIFYIRSIILSIKLYASNREHPNLAGVGGRWGDF